MSTDTDIIIEIKSVGRALKVTAICCRTGEEVSIVGDPKAPQAHLKQLAARKLRFVQAKRAGR